MPKSTHYITVLLAALLAVLLTANAAAFDILHAPDGDSLQGANNQRARLLCIDAPELKQRGGIAAQHALEQYLQRDLRVQSLGKDRYKRHLVLLTDSSGQSINLALVRDGHAWVSRINADSCGLPTGALYAAEKSARRAKRGLWRQNNPLPPWRWRKLNPRT